MKHNFRAWYKGDIDDGKPLLFEQREIDYELYFVCVEDEVIRYPFYILFLDDDWTIERGIGTTDIDGQNIFEGDLLFDDYNNTTGQVIWNDVDLRYDIYVIDEDFSFSEQLTKGYANSLKIVGNIHECDLRCANEYKTPETNCSKKYSIVIEGNTVYAESTVKMLVEMLGVSNIEVVFNDTNLASTTRPINWFRVKCVEITSTECDKTT